MGREKKQATVLIIGGGTTGTGLARDLALRGVTSLLLEGGDINAGASGRNHGLLHSGARYVSNDAHSASQCKEENELLKKRAPELIEETGGLFVAVPGDDENFIADFPRFCEQAGVACRKLDVKEALEIEPVLSSDIIAAYAVDDATVDPFGLSLANITEAIGLGAELMLHTRVTGFKIAGGRIRSVLAIEPHSGKTFEIEAQMVVNAAGAWSGMIAGMAGISIRMAYSKGSLLVTGSRINRQVVNRLRPPSDADILVPGGTVSILGTTSIRLDSLDDIRPTVDEVDAIISELAPVVPVLEETRYIRAYAGVRPLIINEENSNDRAVSRDFELYDHAMDQVKNMVTITGGKLTTFRFMAEKAADLVCRKLGISAACTTKQTPLKLPDEQTSTVPGRSPKIWLNEHDKDDTLLCECEMVPKSAIDHIIEHDARPGPVNLNSVGLRSRIGKGACQGSFCSIRILGHLYNRKFYQDRRGLEDLKEFLEERWQGQRTIFWDTQLAQAELSEAMHCGLFNLHNTLNTSEQDHEPT